MQTQHEIKRMEDYNDKLGQHHLKQYSFCTLSSSNGWTNNQVDKINIACKQSTYTEPHKYIKIGIQNNIKKYQILTYFLCKSFSLATQNIYNYASHLSSVASKEVADYN